MLLRRRYEGQREGGKYVACAKCKVLNTRITVVEAKLSFETSKYRCLIKLNVKETENGVLNCDHLDKASGQWQVP